MGDLADRAFREIRTRNGQLTNASRALLGPVVQEETFTESDTATTLEAVAKFTVVDPDAFRVSAPAFASYNAGMRDRGTFSAAQLKPEARAGFEAFKADLARAPAGHPLKLAAQRGDDALLDAIAAGKGDVTIRTRVVVPKRETVITGKRAAVPRFSGSTFDYAQTTPKELRLVPSATEAAPRAEVDDAPSSRGQGTSTRVSKFLAGFTRHQSFDWEERWEFGTRDYFAIGAHAGYAVGLRIPLEVTTRMTPTSLTRPGFPDADGTYDVFVKARPVDANEQFYMDVGLSKTAAYEGKELVLEAEAYATVDVVAGWGTIKIHERIPNNAGFDFGQNFTPPFDDCGTRCGVEAWVPATVTRTELNILGVVSGRAQIGVNLSGRGTVGVEYTSLFGDATVDSSLGALRRTHSLSFDRGEERRITTILPPIVPEMRLMSGSRSYGYRLASPTYAWTLVATPGVKGTVRVNARPFFSLEEVIGPFWLSPFAMELGTVAFAAHAGTKQTVSVKTGEKSFGTSMAVTAAPTASAVFAPAKK